MANIRRVIGGSIGTNCYLIEEDGSAVLVDYVPQVRKILDAGGLKVEKVLLTHIHFDHIEMLSAFQKNNVFDLYLSEDGLRSINDPEKNLLTYAAPMIDTDSMDRIDLGNAKSVSQGDVIVWKNHPFDVLSSPGHSPDSLMYMLADNKCVFSGDTLFYMSVGRTDFPGSSHEKLIGSIRNLFDAAGDDFTVYPGHGDRTTIGNEKKNNPFLV
jgi:hydroxyacylglutathione hydrolase